MKKTLGYTLLFSPLLAFIVLLYLAGGIEWIIAALVSAAFAILLLVLTSCGLALLNK